MSENKNCADFIASYKSDIITCFSCKYWHHEDFVCLNPEEMRKRRKENEFDDLSKMMRKNKPIHGPL